MQKTGTHRQKLLFLIMIGLICLLSGCFKHTSSLDSMETVLYQDPHGYQLTIPQEWMSVTEGNTVTFTSADGQISLKIITELGGYGFYSMEEIGGNVLEALRQQFADIFVERELFVINAKKQFRQLLSFSEQGSRMKMDNYIYSPMASVNYFLFFVAEENNYNNMSGIFNDIIRSLSLYLSADEIYLQLPA